MSGATLHIVFDIAAWLAAGTAAVWLSRAMRLRFPTQSFALPYIAALVFGAGLGAYLFGTLNLWLSGSAGLARSVEGAIAIGIAIGRLGCFFAGLDDFTYGTPTKLPWGHDFGDGIARHPVQLYESAAMAGFAIVYIVAVVRRNGFVIDNGFYLVLAFYGAQRFVWEFLKPYAALIGPLTLFHLLSLAILLYAAVMLVTAPVARVAHERAAA